MLAQSPGEKPASCRALANGCARPLKSRYVSLSFSRSRSASIKHTSPAKRSSASFSADPMDWYLFRSSIGEEDSATESRRHRENKFQRINLLTPSRNKQELRLIRRPNLRFAILMWSAPEPQKRDQTAPRFSVQNRNILHLKF